MQFVLRNFDWSSSFACLKFQYFAASETFNSLVKTVALFNLLRVKERHKIIQEQYNLKNKFHSKEFFKLKKISVLF